MHVIEGAVVRQHPSIWKDLKYYTHVVLNHLIILRDQISLNEWFLYK